MLHAQGTEARRDTLVEARRIVKRDGVIILTDFSRRRTWAGLPAHAVVYVVESLALDDHRKNFHRFRKNGYIRAVAERHGFPPVASQAFYYGALETLVTRNEKT